jgi:hypothetical protein
MISPNAILLKQLIIIYLLLLPTSVANAKGIQLFNTNILGSSTNQAIKLMQDSKPGDVEPETIMIGIKEGKYFAATVRYPKDLSIKDAKATLNNLYKKYEHQAFASDDQTGLWRNDDNKYTVTLTEEGESIQVVYIVYAAFDEEEGKTTIK